MKEIAAALQEWEWLATLPADISGFTLVNQLTQCDNQYRIFTYQHGEKQRSFSVLYDQATKEYLARVIVGLNEYVDINFIAADLLGLEMILQERMEYTIRRLAEFDETTLCTIFREKKITEWVYGRQLPTVIEGFSLYIAPFQPVKVLNGSYIIIDYTDFIAESSLLVYYNIYRDEFFGELRIRRTPQVISTFDTKKINDLELQLRDHLEPTVKKLRALLAGSDEETKGELGNGESIGEGGDGQ